MNTKEGKKETMKEGRKRSRRKGRKIEINRKEESRGKKERRKR